MRWVLVVLVGAALLLTAAGSAGAWATSHIHRCAATQRYPTQGSAWRSRAFAVAGCHAWQHLHHHARHHAVHPVAPERTTSPSPGPVA